MTDVKFPIDFVVTWVNGQDEIWQKKAKSFGHEINPERFRDYGFFKYWFRAVEKYAPWVRNVILITDNQIPDFLVLDHPKLRVIDHSEFMPQTALPSFNSNAIEMNISKIQGLSEHFVLFNDDMYLNAPVQPTDFFDKNGLPKDSFGLNAIMPVENFDYITMNNMVLINQEFNKRKVIRQNFEKVLNIKNGILNFLTLGQIVYPRFSRFFDLHAPYSFEKTTFENVLTQHESYRNITLNNRFRSKTDISIWLVRYYQLAQGRFSNRNVRFSKFYTVSDSETIARDIKNNRHKVIDINDEPGLNDNELNNHLETIISAFKLALWEKSSFER